MRVLMFCFSFPSGIWCGNLNSILQPLWLLFLFLSMGLFQSRSLVSLRTKLVKLSHRRENDAFLLFVHIVVISKTKSGVNCVCIGIYYFCSFISSPEPKAHKVSL